MSGLEPEYETDEESSKIEVAVPNCVPPTINLTFCTSKGVVASLLIVMLEIFAPSADDAVKMKEPKRMLYAPATYDGLANDGFKAAVRGDVAIESVLPVAVPEVDVWK